MGGRQRQGGFKRLRIGAAVVAAAFAFSAAAEEPGETQEPAATYFRIGTGPVGGTYFPVGGLIADVLTFRPGGPDCAAGGCGVPGLLAVAQISQGSVENVLLVQNGSIESALAQADVAYWMYMGQWVFSGREPAGGLRVIANLYTESIQIVVRRDAGIATVADLKGKRVALGDAGSGTDLDARVVLGAHGLIESGVAAEHLNPVLAAEKLRAGKLDAFFMVSGTPVPAIAELAEETAGTPDAVTLVPIAEPHAGYVRAAYPFYEAVVIPGHTYAGIPPTATLGVKAQWLVSERVDAGLVYEMTRALWSKPARKLLDAGHPEGRHIRLEDALAGVLLPLHPGAERYYREAGLLK